MDLVVRTEIGLSEPTVDSGFVTWLSFDVVDHSLDGRGASTLGTGEAAIVHLGTGTVHLHDVLDADSAELEALYDIYFDGQWFKPDHAQGAGCDLLYFAGLDVAPRHRGKNIEYAVVRRVADTLGTGCGLVVLAYSSPAEVAFWERMGFEVSTPGHASGFLHLQLAKAHPRIVKRMNEFKVLPNLSRADWQRVH
jgi:GNAT superfamily N-acetyltransferase